MVVGAAAAQPRSALAAGSATLLPAAAWVSQSSSSACIKGFSSGMGVTCAHLGPCKLLGGCAGVCCCDLLAPLQLSSPAADLASELLDALLCSPEHRLHPAASQTHSRTLPHISPLSDKAVQTLPQRAPLPTAMLCSSS